MDGKRHVDLATVNDEDLLRLRFCDLGVRIAGTWLEQRVAALYAELAAKGIVFRPQCYLGDEWFAPDNEPVVAIPFYLAHPRLRALEQKLMHDVEGGDIPSCMKLLRHETGHAVNYAYHLYGRPRWRKLFGRFTEEYPDRYKYRPYSRSFVLHLDDWYAQYHPDEDFAETFAVWLDPDADWKRRYRGWKALEKLEYVDALMREIAAKAPRKTTGRKLWNIATLKSTLRTHYKRKSEFYAEYSPDFHDRALARIFPAETSASLVPAHRSLSSCRRNVLENVAHWTGERKHIIERLYRTLVKRARELKLTAVAGDPAPGVRTAAYVTTLIMNYIYTGRFRRKR